MVILENEHLYASIHPKGAELQELRKKSTGINYMWSGDPAYWGKFSPVLFPVVGTLRDNKFIYNGKEYTLPRHGFARDRTFIVEQLTPGSATFTLQDDAETRVNYPFAFKLQLHYQLEENQLLCRYTVTNSGEEKLLFSIGAHPAFSVPLIMEGITTSYSDYYLEFNCSQVLQRHQLFDGLVMPETQELQLEGHRLPLDPALFREDALVLKGLPDTEIRLGSALHPHGLSFRWEGFPYFGIWAAKDAPFVCLEPWCGVADSVTHNQQLEEKEGIEKLSPGDMWTRYWSVTVY